MSMHNLALTCQSQGRWGEAEELQVEVLEMKKRVLRQGHPSTLESMYTPECAWKSQGRDVEVIRLMEQMERIQRERLGSDNPLVTDPS